MCARAVGAADFSSGGDHHHGSSGSNKFDRILRFVDQHDLRATTAAAAAASASAPEPAAAAAADASAAAAPSWHLSYDEEAEEGEEQPAAAVPAHEAAALAAAAHALAAGPACSVAFLHGADGAADAAAMPAAAAALDAAAAAPAVGSAAYFAAKPWGASYDEEAEGCFEAAAAAARAERAGRLATYMERRAESRAAARPRRAALRAAVGDLEAMAPWVDDAAAAKAAAAARAAAGRVPPGRYPHLQAFLAARGGAGGAVEAFVESLQRERGLQARAPQPWVYTFDEEAHGCGAGTALSSM